MHILDLQCPLRDAPSATIGWREFVAGAGAALSSLGTMLATGGAACAAAENSLTSKALNRETRRAALIVGRPMGAVKARSANLYATKMAERGLVTLSLDRSFRGGSKGSQRNAVFSRHFGSRQAA